MRCWIFQDNRQRDKHGAKAKWNVGWIDSEGRRKRKTIGCKSMAEKYSRKLEGQLAAGLVETDSRVDWAKFRSEYETTIMPTWRSGTSRVEATHSLDAFERIARPKYVSRINKKMLDSFAAERLTEPGKKKGDTLSPETVKKDLRAIRAALSIAQRWDYMRHVPGMPEIKGYGKDKPFVTEEHFKDMMAHCGAARMPEGQHFTPEAFWRALLATAWVTGMRKGAMLSLLWEDVDLDAGTAISRHTHNKAKRDETKQIGLVAGLLKSIKGFDSRVFPWNHSLKSLDRDLARIQKASGIHLVCREDHEHTDACHNYGFHSFRYAHATYNFGRVSDRELQQQMGHASFTTTQHYIKYAEAHQRKTYDAHFPDVLKGAAG